MFRRRSHHLCALIGLGLFAHACASAPVAKPRAVERDLDAIVRGRLATAELEGEHRLRFNPVACDCPELEVFVADNWYRVALVDGDSLVINALRRALDEGSPDARGVEYIVVGRLNDTPARCGRAALYLTLEPETWVGEKP